MVLHCRAQTVNKKMRDQGCERNTSSSLARAHPHWTVSVKWAVHVCKPWIQLETSRAHCLLLYLPFSHLLAPLGGLSRWMRQLSRRIPTQSQDSMSMDTRALTHMQIHTLTSTHTKRRKKRISKGKYLFRKRRRRMNVSTLVFIRQPTQVSVRVKEKGCHWG